MKVDLTRMKMGEEGVIAEINGGHKLEKRLQSLGVNLGAKIKKISAQMLRGPISIQVGNTKAAIGYGMAKKIWIEKDQL
ncbi:ferrous iron transport protein A [candidate division KSB1 bacterium]|nr:ferrous iron transport protein A [candidate division KSB1 bacterium]